MVHDPQPTKSGRRLFLFFLFVCLLLSCVFDRSARGTPRFALFPAAVALSDHHLWDCLRNSVAIAAATSIVAVIAGVPLGWTLARFRPVGTGVILAAFASLGVLPPISLAIGLEQVGPRFETLLGRSPLWSLWGLDGRWVGLLWAECSWSAAWMVGVTLLSLRRLDPAWEDAAILAGAGRRQIAVTLIWPRIRPEVCRAAGLIFLTILFEPSGPWILEARRTLAYQLVQTARSVDEGAVCSVLAVLGLLAALGVQGVLRLVGGPVKPVDPIEEPRRLSPLPFARRVLALPPLLLALIVGWAPIAWLVQTLFGSAGIRAEVLAKLVQSPFWWSSMAWTLGLAVVATLLTRWTFRLWNRIDRGHATIGISPPIPADGIPPSLLSALLILAVVRCGWMMGVGDLQSGLGWEITQNWRGTGFAPVLLVASLWFSLVLAAVDSPLSWGSRSRWQRSDLAVPEDRWERPWGENRRGWVGDLGLCTTFAGPALLFGTVGRSLAASMAFDVPGEDATQPIAVSALLLAALAILLRGRRDWTFPARRP